MLLGPEKPATVLGHHPGGAAGQKLGGVLLPTGGRGAVGHGDAAVRTGLRDFRRRELHIRAVRLRRRLLGAAARFWRFRDGRLTGFHAQRRADHAARLLRRAARPGRILKLMADEGRQRFHKKHLRT